MTGGAVEIARRFVGAIAWGEHRTVWELLSGEGRSAVLRVATRRGMDESLSARLRDAQATRTEEETFLTDLLNGLRADLAGTDLDALEFDVEPGPAEPDRERITLIAPVAAAIGVPGLPVGTIELAQCDDGWLVDRLLPRVTR
ncbi:MAG: hypothetical protein M3527_01375 [Actinomycetota bacterium]|nr:hypothetical protein [Acidimicrobiia bacterium]MDQ3293092.1 hypothetical protein [Actinomycetota bacterium]